MAPFPLFSHLVHSGAVVRHTLPVANATAVDRLTPSAICDDGFVAWINGVEVARYNLPAGPVVLTWADDRGSKTWRNPRMDPRITGDPAYREPARGAFHTLPTFVIATEAENLFSRQTGIYANPEGSGLVWERPASAEWIFPDGRIPTATGSWHLCAATPGTPNQAVTLASPTSLVLNEWQPDPETADVPWIELHNRDLTLPAALRGLYLAIDDMVGFDPVSEPALDAAFRNKYGNNPAHWHAAPPTAGRVYDSVAGPSLTFDFNPSTARLTLTWSATPGGRYVVQHHHELLATGWQ